MEVIAEGVEHSEQIEQLRLYNCDTIQGYFYSKPLASADFRKFLEEHRSRK
jgi:EAL domain-containing protein (putative c-di-GMP-specific phosphodiesterase class I)